MNKNIEKIKELLEIQKIVSEHRKYFNKYLDINFNVIETIIIGEILKIILNKELEIPIYKVSEIIKDILESYKKVK